MYPLLDTNHDVTNKLPQLKALGIKTIIRYIGSRSISEKYIKTPEAQAIANAGLRLGIVFEVWGGSSNFAHSDINSATGVSHADFAERYMKELGAPEGAACYFAIDNDVTENQLNGLVVPYFRSINRTLKSYKIGVYGCGSICQRMLDLKLASYSWLSNAMGWTGSRAFRDSKRWNILQHLPAKIAGLDTDPDEVQSAPSINSEQFSIGDFVPFEDKISNPPMLVQTIHDARWLQKRLNDLGQIPPLVVDGDIGLLTVSAIEKYLPKVTS